MSARRVVTLPSDVRGEAAITFAEQARRSGAQLFEVRTDLHGPDDVPIFALADKLPLLVSLRGRPLPQRWTDAATWVDVPVETSPESTAVWRGKLLLSHHADTPLSAEAAAAVWQHAPAHQAQHWKHVEPLGAPPAFARLFATRAALRALGGLQTQLTVLALGPTALPFRCVLAQDNALDYLALSETWVAAPGQRLLADAVREEAAHACGKAKDGRHLRLGIFGTRIAGSRSPRLHTQPFDRLDLPDDTALPPLLEALHPHYRGFAVTSPFKRAAAKAVDAPLDAVNTLVRHAHGYRGVNTDVAGARAVLEALGTRTVTVLGSGGVSVALVQAACELGVTLTLRRREELTNAQRSGALKLQGSVVWTWPEGVTPPPGLRLDGATVALIVYGAAARRLEAAVVAHGGVPRRLGARWFIAQAREQRRLWEEAR